MKGPLSRLLIGLAIADFIAAVDTTAVTIAMPRIAEGYGISSGQASLLHVIYTAALVMALIPIGRVGDMYGHKRNFFVGLGLFAASSLLIMVAPSFWLILALRLLQGAAAGILYTSSGALIARHWEKTELAFGITAAFFSIGMLVGPVLGGVLTDTSILGIDGWRLIFAINLPLAALSGWLVFGTSRETASKKVASGFDWVGLALLGSFLGLMAVLLVQPESRTQLLIGALVALAAFVAYERRAAEPLITLAIFRTRTFTAVSFFTLVCMVCLNAVSFISTFYLQDVLSLSATRAGLFLLPIPLGMGVFAVLAGSFRNWRAGCLAGAVLITAGLAILSRADPGIPYFQALFWGYLVLSAGAGFMMTNTFAAALGSVPIGFSGVSAGYINTVQQLGTLAGITFAASYDVVSRYQALYGFLAVLATLAIVSALLVQNPPATKNSP